MTIFKREGKLCAQERDDDKVMYPDLIFPGWRRTCRGW